MPEKTHSHFNLDPGMPRVRRKVSLWSGCKCLFWISCFLSSTLVVALVVALINFFFLFLFHPHRALYLNPALLSCQPGCVVRPLIDAQQTFDIAVTVWVRATEKEEEIFQQNHPWEARVLFGRSFSEERNFDDLVSDSSWTTVTTELIESEVILETPLYSDFAFRGLRLSDKGISTVINFRLPTARFLGVDLSSSDLRASFVLIPSSPSPMDHLKNFSSWLPDYIELLPRRARPFPLGSPDQGDRALEDEALESFSISIPLIKFQEIQSRCPISTRKEHTDHRDRKLDGPADYDISKKEPEGKKRDIPVYKRHPHVITRTHLRVVDETKLFDRRVYDERHNALKATFCGGDVNFRRGCFRDYLANGHWETHLQLEVPIPANKTETEIHWAYAPYLSTLKHGAGPLDLIAVPVSHENCSTNTDEIAASSGVEGFFPKPVDEEFMDISWRISYSGRSPGMLQFADIFSWPINYIASPSTKSAMQDRAELINGIFGHRFHDDAHPRRRILAFLFDEACWYALLFLNLHYWYTRTSTISISIPGTTFLAIRFVLGTVIEIASSGGSIILMLMLFPRASSMMIRAIIMIVAITRVDFRWKGATWIPIVRRMATHKERASMRLDNQTSWRAKTGLLLSLVWINYFFAPRNRFVIPPAMPLDVFQDNNSLLDPSIILQPLAFAGRILQLLLNHRSHSFAGQYKSSVVLNLMFQATFFATFVPALLGRINTREGVTVQHMGHLILLAVEAWQALILPSVSQTGFDEDEE